MACHPGLPQHLFLIWLMTHKMYNKHTIQIVQLFVVSKCGLFPVSIDGPLTDSMFLCYKIVNPSIPHQLYFH